jgi:hypothetical protein
LQRETPQVGARKSDFPHQAPEAINQTPVVNDPHTAFRHELKCQRIDTVFGLRTRMAISLSPGCTLTAPCVMIGLDRVLAT